MAIEQYDDSDKKAEWKRVMSFGLVRLVEGVRFAEFVLVVFELFLLFRGKDSKLPLLLRVCAIHWS